MWHVGSLAVSEGAILLGGLTVAVVVGCALGWFRLPWWMAPLIGFVIGLGIGAAALEPDELETGAGGRASGFIGLSYAVITLGNYAVGGVARNLAEWLRARRRPPKGPPRNAS